MSNFSDFNWLRGGVEIEVVTAVEFQIKIKGNGMNKFTKILPVFIVTLAGTYQAQAEDATLLAYTLPAMTATSQEALTRGPDAVETKLQLQKEDSIEAQVKVSPFVGISTFSMSSDSFNTNGVDATSKGDFQPGLTIGALVDVGDMATKNRVLATGIMLYQAGAELDVTNNGLKKTATVDAIYMTIPMLAKTRVVSGKEIYFKGGFNNSILLTESVEGVSDNNIDSRGFDVLGSLGVSGKFDYRGKKDLSVEASYNHSVFDARQRFTSTQSQGFFVTLGMPL